jgi:DNA-binding transcriptional LysR family regulator
MEDKALDKMNGVTLYEEQLSLMVPKSMLSTRKKTITWKEVAELPLCLLSPYMKERQVMDEAFSIVDCNPSPKLECNSIFQLAFHVMQGALATIVPSGFSRANDAFPGTREIHLTDPVISKPVGLVWEKVNPPLPMAQAFADLLIASSDDISASLEMSVDQSVSTKTVA